MDDKAVVDWFDLGVVHHRAGRLADAQQAFQACLALDPDHVNAHYNLGIVALQLGELDTANQAFQAAVNRQPDRGQAWFYLGQTLQLCKRFQDAIPAYRQATRLQPEDASGWLKLAICQNHTFQYADAIDSWSQAVDLAPETKQAYFGLLHALTCSRAHEKAEQVIRQALQRWPQDADFGAKLVYNLDRQFRLAELDDWWSGQPELLSMPHIQVKRAMQLPRIPMSRQEIQAARQLMSQELDRLTAEGIVLENPIVEPGKTNFVAAYHGCNDRPLQEKVARFYLKACPRLGWVAPHCEPGATRPPRPDGRIRIGFVSRYFRSGHAVELSYMPTIRRLDRSRFHVTLFYITGDSLPDEALAREVDSIISLDTQRLKVLQDRVAAAQMDILVYLDIGMDPVSYCLSFARLAPVQCALDGHPVTSGVPNLDYFVTAGDYEAEDADDHYSEQLIKLESVGGYYERPEYRSGNAILPTLGVDPSRTVYFVGQMLFKLHPDFDDVVGGILRRDPQGEMLLVASRYPQDKALWLKRFSSRFADVADRVRFVPILPFEQFANLMSEVDAFLDPNWFGGGTTILNCFAFGVPIVTLPGPFLRNRVAYGTYKRLGITDLVASDIEDYVALAFRLAHDKTWRDGIKRAILAASDGLYRSEESVREMEAFYDAAHQASMAGHRVTQWPMASR